MELAVKNSPKALTEGEAQSGLFSQLQGWHKHGLALLFFLLLTVWLTWPVLPNAGRSLEQWGDALLQTYTLDWDAHALATDPLHLFNANVFYPYQNSLAFSESLIGQAFLVTPLIWLTNNPVLAFNTLLLLSFILSGWGMYLLVYELTGNRGAGLVSGVIFAFFPNRFTQFSHLHLLATQWMPFCLLYLRRFLKDYRWYNGLLFGLCFVLELLSSTYLGLFLMVCVGLYLAFSWVAGRFRLRWWPLVKISLVLAVCALVVLPFLKPYFDVKNDLGFERSQAEVENWSAAPTYYFDLFKFNRLNVEFLTPLLKGLHWWEVGGGERQLYLGLTAMLLLPFGLAAVWRRRKTARDGLFYVLLGGVALVFTFGPVWHSGRFGDLPLPYALLYNFLPGFQALRVPVRFIYVVALAVAVLAGFAVAALAPRLRLHPFGFGLAVGILIGLLGLVFGWPLWLALPGALGAGGLGFGIQSKLGQLQSGGRSYNFALVALLLGLLCFEYATDVAIKDSDLLHSPPPAALWLAQHPGPVLDVPLSGTNYTDMFYMYWSRLSWQPLMNGSSGFMPPAYDALRTAWSTEFPSARLVTLLQGLEIRYLVLDSDNPEVQPTWKQTQKALANFPQLKIAAQFGGVFIYELQSDPWLRNLGHTLKPSDPLLLVEYKRNQPQLLELAAYYLERTGVSRSDALYGNISLANRALPGLPVGTPAHYALIQSGEDPTLYGFQPKDKKWGNALADFYQQDPQLLARYDFSHSTATQVQTAPLTFGVAADKLVFDTSSAKTSPAGLDKSGSQYYLRLELAVLSAQTLTLTLGDQSFSLNLEPGLSLYQTTSFGIPNGNQVGVTLKNSDGKPFLLTEAELWQTANLVKPELSLQRNVVLVQAASHRVGGESVTDLNLITPGANAAKYTATLDVYTRPYGAHPQGHYGYWSVALDGGGNLQFRLDLAQKKMQTQLNGGSVPNYPPDPKDLDISRYAKIGDFRASVNLYRGEQFVGSIQVFDFTVNGDKTEATSRRVTDFVPYNAAITYLVLKQN